MSERERFHIEGGGCWCPGSWTLEKLRIEGHSPLCTSARESWRQNMRNLSEIERQKREDEAAGRALREAAEAVLARGAA